MRTTPHDNVFDFNAILQPGTMFSHPCDVVDDPNFSLTAKRAIALRALDGKGPVTAASPCVCARQSVGQRREPESANDSMTDVTQLMPGCFYWVLVRSSTKHPEWQPARFTGVSCQSASAKWDFIGFYSDVGHYFIEVVDIGPELLS